MSLVDMALVGLFLGLMSLTWTVSGAGPREVFTNQFYVELEKDLPNSEVHSLAKRHGFVNLGPVSYYDPCTYLRPHDVGIQKRVEFNWECYKIGRR